MNASTSLAEIKRPAITEVAMQPDQKIDMFSLRGFELAQRIARAFATSDAVPAQFRALNLKKVKVGNDYNETWVENDAALGNCLVAIETARAVGMSITSVMQHANIIENRLTWSAQFVIAAINASGRFKPLRFDLQDRGRIKAKYREKGGWNNQKKGFDFIEKEVEIEDIKCVAWTLPKQVSDVGIYTLQQAKDAKMPVIESAPVSMKLAVEEGWYSKPGSKWQTEMKHLMLQYRAGAFFGRIHAPDIVMGMGRTSEEVLDMTTLDVDGSGQVTSITTQELRRNNAPAPAVEVVQNVSERAEPPALTDQPDADGVLSGASSDSKGQGPTFDAKAFAEKLEGCKDVDTLDLLADELRNIDQDTAEGLAAIYRRRRDEILNPPSTATNQQQPAAAARRTRAPVQSSIE